MAKFQHDCQPHRNQGRLVLAPGPGRGSLRPMRRWMVTGLAIGLLAAFIATSCAGKRKPPKVAPGHHLCTYCCTTANVDCSCELLDAVECPEPGETAKLSACAECRMCTRRVEPGASCEQP